MKIFKPSAKVFAFAPIVRGNNRLEVKAGDDKHEIVLLGTIGKSHWDDSGVSEKEFRDALNSIPNGKKITIRVNSEGGSVKEGLGIYNAIKSRREDITCRVDGYALSISSVFPLAASKVISPKSAIWMIHNAWSWATGNASDMEAAAVMLKEHDKMLAEIYAEETGKTLKEIEGAMVAETWIRGSAAIDFGLADETGDEEKENANASYRPIHSDFLKRCKNLSPEIFNAISAPSQGADVNNKQKENTVNKEQKLALLKSWGVEASASTAESELDALIEKGKPVANKTEPTNVDDIAVIKAKLAKAERREIENRVRKYVLENKITNDEVEIFVNAAVNDEKETFAILDKKEAVLAGGNPVNNNLIILSENPLEKIRKDHKTLSARYNAMKDDWVALYQDAEKRDARASRGGQVMAANTYSATLVTSFLEAGAITPLQNVWAALSCFTREFGVDTFKPLATAVIKNTTAGAATQTDATNFESGDSTVGPLSVTMHQYTQSFQVSNSDLNNGLRMEDLVTINVANFANKVIEVATVPITTANFTATPLISAAAAFGWSDMATLWGQLKKSPIKNVMLDGEYLARLTNTPGNFQNTGTGEEGSFATFGWNKLALNTDWAGAGANIRGFACNPQAIAAVAGLPATPPTIPGNILQMSTMVVPGLNVPVAMFQWYNPATRSMWWSYDIMFGVVKADGTAGIVIKSA